jgi:hypothetical protein
VGWIERGVALCHALPDRGPRFWLVTKPGGFGGDDVLIKSVRRLRRVD